MGRSMRGAYAYSEPEPAKILNKFCDILVIAIGDKLITKFVPKMITKFNTQFGDSLYWPPNLSQKLSRN